MRRFVLLALAFAAACAAPQTAASQPRPMPTLVALDDALQTLSARVAPSIVRVQTLGYAPLTGSQATPTSLLARRRSVGSGVVVAPGGLIVTNHHVVEGASRVWVEVQPSAGSSGERRSILGAPTRRLEARLLGSDAETDLALLQVDAGDTDLPALPLGDSEGLAPGQLVVAFGSPLGLEGSVTMGVVSAVARQLRPDHPMVFIQTDAAINPGSSGGPLIDLQGRIIGINTLIFSRSGGSEGVGFAVPAHIVSTVVEQLRSQGRVRRGLVGLVAQTITAPLADALALPQRWGVLVGDVLPGSPAAAAGLAPGDVVRALDGKTMENARQLDVNLYARRVGDRVRLEVLRGDERLEVEVAVVERPNAPFRPGTLPDPRDAKIPRIGVLAVDLGPELAARIPRLRSDQGAVVLAGAGGFQPGDVIHRVGRTPVADVAALRGALAALPAGTPIVLQVERAGTLRFVSLDDP
ncbi:MAG: trypsin-like peptidase domain-containing protein [Myxococcota bacterium]